MPRAAANGIEIEYETFGPAAAPAAAAILHGEADPLIPLAATARAVPGADLRVIPGMGHDLAEPLYDTIIDAIVAAATRAG